MALAALFASCGGGHATRGVGGAGVIEGTGGSGGSTSPGSAGAGGSSAPAGAGGSAGSAGIGGLSGSGGAGGAPFDAGGFDATDAGFASDFAARARTELAAVSPSWNCDTALPTVAVADPDAAGEAIRQYVAQVAGLSPADLTITPQACGTPASATCANIFGHDAAKSGGQTYDTIIALGEELEANAADIEVTLWIPAGTGAAIAVVMSGISDGQLVGMVLFEAAYPCH
jgi:hypothetical protein